MDPKTLFREESEIFREVDKFLIFLKLSLYFQSWTWFVTKTDPNTLHKV